ncbi:ABC transporter permease [Sphaerisporangium perillae]|uniref:ABC transporter permease n=1 Tax=Sphaerisporangium perillae TaxID=2935860 RepID=UPI00200F8277|nr:ABC transporter permease subunit [Sphaerisporangium perillae]
MSAPAVPVTAPQGTLRLPRWAVLAGIAVLFTVGYLLYRGTGTLPHDDEAAPFLFINDARETIDAGRNENPLFLYLINYLRLFTAGLYDLLEVGLTALGWPGLIGVMGALGWLAGGWRIALLAAAGFVSFGVLGLWEASVLTLALIVAAVLLALVVGIPLGIWTGGSARVRRLITPVLDVMQIMPTFAYLAPMVLFFQIGPASATVATLIYALPVTIRITALAIEQVSPTAIEASASLGATRRQTLRKVQLPMARETIALAINQTIMMALSMVVIAALISAPGLGSDIVRGLSRANVGFMLPAGVAIVIMAIVLDRMTMAAARRRVSDRVSYVAAGMLALAGLALAAVLPAEFPEEWRISFAGPVNDAVTWAKFSWYDVTTAIKNISSEALLNPLQGLLTSAPWWLVAAAVLAVAWWSSGVRPALTALGCLVAIALLGLWEHGMETLTTVLVAVALTLLIGLLLGIAAARSLRFSAVQRPLLDAAQTMPAFVYLLPALALFGATRFTAIFASVIYAVPPVARLVEEGIRGVPPTVVEAAVSTGSTSGQLLWKVQLPMARRAILLAANQGIVMTLAMVVVGGLVGAGGLGYDVVSGFVQRTDFGMGFTAGVATVLLGIMLDRITQGADRRPSP